MSLPESNVPPGFQSGLKVHVSGGGENTEWFSFEKKKGYTNAFIICGTKAIYRFFSVVLGTIFTFLSVYATDTTRIQEARIRERIVSFFPLQFTVSESPDDKLPG